MPEAPIKLRAGWGQNGGGGGYANLSIMILEQVYPHTVAQVDMREIFGKTSLGFMYNMEETLIVIEKKKIKRTQHIYVNPMKN